MNFTNFFKIYLDLQSELTIDQQAVYPGYTDNAVSPSGGALTLLHCSTLAMAMGYPLLPLKCGAGISHGACWLRNQQLMVWGSVWVTEKPAKTFHRAVVACPTAVTKLVSPGKAS